MLIAKQGGQVAGDGGVGPIGGGGHQKPAGAILKPPNHRQFVGPATLAAGSDPAAPLHSTAGGRSAHCRQPLPCAACRSCQGRALGGGVRKPDSPGQLLRPGALRCGADPTRPSQQGGSGRLAKLVWKLGPRDLQRQGRNTPSSDEYDFIRWRLPGHGQPHLPPAAQTLGRRRCGTSKATPCPAASRLAPLPYG